MARAAVKPKEKATPKKPAARAAAQRPAPQSVRKRQPQEVMARILDAATAAFTNDGYKGARMRSIATDAGISIQLLIYHAKTKEDLWHMVMEHILKKFDQFTTETKALPKSATAAERLRHMIADIVHYTSTEPELHRIMTQEGNQLSPRLMWIIENFTRPAYDEFVKLAEQAQREGALRPNITPARLRFAVQAMAAVPFSVSAEYEFFTGKSPFTRGEIEKTIEQINIMVFND